MKSKKALLVSLSASKLALTMQYANAQTCAVDETGLSVSSLSDSLLSSGIIDEDDGSKDSGSDDSGDSKDGGDGGTGDSQTLNAGSAVDGATLDIGVSGALMSPSASVYIAYSTAKGAGVTPPLCEGAVELDPATLQIVYAARVFAPEVQLSASTPLGEVEYLPSSNDLINVRVKLTALLESLQGVENLYVQALVISTDSEGNFEWDKGAASPLLTLAINHADSGDDGDDGGK